MVVVSGRYLVSILLCLGNAKSAQCLRRIDVTRLGKGLRHVFCFQSWMGGVRRHGGGRYFTYIASPIDASVSQYL